MNISADPLLLPRLLIGLEALREQRKAYPYPASLCIAWNSLSLLWIAAGRTSTPISINDLLALCTQPVGNWFPASLPLDFPSKASLLHSGSGIELTEFAHCYLSENILRDERINDLADAAQVERSLQNKLFTRILSGLRNTKNLSRAQDDYVLLRRFLISHPFATTTQIVTSFSSTYFIKPQDVGELYNLCMPNETYYCCSTCGPLFKEHGRWRGAKPDVCSDHLDEQGLPPEVVPFEEGLRHLLWAIHERVCLHGIEEVRWLDTAHRMHCSKPAKLIKIEDWPGIDMYDMRLTFADGTVWAADMKDYRDPEELGKGLKSFGLLPEAHCYDSAFYVIPDRREARNKDYCQRVRENALLPDNHQILTVSKFFQVVEKQIRLRKKGSALI